MALVGNQFRLAREIGTFSCTVEAEPWSDRFPKPVAKSGDDVSVMLRGRGGKGERATPVVTGCGCEEEAEVMVGDNMTGLGARTLGLRLNVRDWREGESTMVGCEGCDEAGKEKIGSLRVPCALIVS